MTRLAALSLSVLLLVLALAGGATRPTRAAGGADDDGAVRDTLPNGLRVLLVRNTIAPVVSTVVTYLVGSDDDPPDFPGLAHAQEHMMFRGTSNLSTDQLSTIATALGGNFNAYTRPTVTQYQFTVPAANLDAVLRIESDRMRDVLDAQDQWADERGAIEQEVAMDESAPGADFYRAASRAAFGDTPYAHDGVGTKASFDRLTGAELKAFHQRWYAPNNAVLVIAGDVEPRAALAQVRAAFGEIPRRPVPEHPAVHLPPARRVILTRAATLPYPLAAVGYRMPGLRSRDFVAAFVLQAVLNGERGAFKELAASGRVLDAGFEAQPALPDAELAFALAALPPSADPRRMTSDLEQIIARYVRDGIPSELFAAAKRRVIADQELSRNSINELASDWSDVITVDEEPSIAHEIELLQRVTLADVNRIAREYLRPQRAIVGALIPSASRPSGPPPTAQKGRENPLPERGATLALPAWARAVVANVSVARPSVRPTVSTLSNGIRLVVQPESISRSVSVLGGIKTNPFVEEPAGEEGVSQVLDRLFAYGSASHDRTAYARLLDDIAANESGGSRFQISLTAENFERGVDLLAENELHPRFAPAEFETARQGAAGAAAAALNGSHVIARHQLDRRLLPADDPGLRMSTPQTIGALRLPQVEAYYKRTFRSDLTTIVVVGDVTPERARAAIERSFGGWHAEGPVPPLELPPVRLNGPGRTSLTLGTQQDSVTLAELIAITRDDPQYDALALGNAVLGGGAGGPQASRLFRDLRQNSGLVYFVNSRLFAGKTRSRFEIEFASAPQNAQRAVELIDREIRSLQHDLVADEELQLTKASLVRRVTLSEADEDTIAQDLLGAALERRPLDASTVAAEHYLATTPAALRDAFAKWIRPDAFVQLVEGP